MSAPEMATGRIRYLSRESVQPNSRSSKGIELYRLAITLLYPLGYQRCQGAAQTVSYTMHTHNRTA